MKKTIFIDRDGVINKDPGGWTEHSYVTRRDDLIFLPNSKEALRKLTEAGFEIIVISNQAGISKGHYTKEKLEEVTRKMTEEIEKNGSRLKKVYYCVHQNSDNCDCRKPKTGLFERAEAELGVQAAGSFFIGDGKTDIEVGLAKGLRTVLVLSGKTDLEKLRGWDIKPDFIFDNLLDAVNFIIGEEKK